MNCREHQQEATSKCTWCATDICDKCRSWAYGKKLCPRCFAKLNSDGVISHARKSTTPAVVVNKDPNLSADRIEEAKKMIAQKDRKRVSPRIRNIPDGA